MARDAGDFFAVGELLASELQRTHPQTVGTVLARIVAAWAAPERTSPRTRASTEELIASLGSISEENAALALVNAVRRLPTPWIDLPGGIGDLAFRLREAIAVSMGSHDKRSHSHACIAAAAKLEAALYDLEFWAVRTIPAHEPGDSKDGIGRRFEKYRTRSIPCSCLRNENSCADLEVLIGQAFRKLCEAYERNDDAEVLQRAPEFLANVKSHTPSIGDPRLRSGVWTAAVAPIVNHVSALVAEAMSRGELGSRALSAVAQWHDQGRPPAGR